MVPIPNILYIATDQWRGDALGFYSKSDVLTPNLDRLAERATVFTRCISNSPLCVPARAAIMTGQLPRESGVWSNAWGADIDGPSHVRELRDAGYFTAVIGKTHLWRTGPGPKAGLHAKEMDHLLEAWGFNHRVEVNDPIGTGSQGCAYTDFAAKHGFVDQHRRYINAWIDELRSGNPTPWAQQPSPAPKFKDIDSFIAQTAIEWLQSFEQSQPFYLQVQFTGPHDPYDGPLDFRELYRHADIDVGITSEVTNPSSILQRRLANRTPVVRATEEQRRQWRINYYANMSLIDHWIGAIFDVLATRGLIDNTWIVFTSDHGEMLGDLGLMGKTVFFEPSIRVPLLIAAPSASGSCVEQLVQQVDLPNTLLEIGGLDAFKHSLGSSLRNCVLNGEEVDNTRCAYSELFGETTVVTDRYKLTVETATLNPTQLIDSHETPDEHLNVVNEKNYEAVREELIQAYVKPIEDRISSAKMQRYSDYVQQTGRLN